MKFAVLTCALALAAAIFPAATAKADEPDRAFFKSAEGDWAGNGEVIAGKFKGTKFSCSFTGLTPANTLGITLDGDCRVGVFGQKMNATILSDGAGYSGRFMDGAAGKGLDIRSGNVVDGRKIMLAINRKQLNGMMQARIADRDTMNVTVSVHVEAKLVPVIGLSLKRVDDLPVGAVSE